MIFTYFNLLYFLIKLSSSQTSFNIFKNKEEAFKKKKKKKTKNNLSEYYQTSDCTKSQERISLQTIYNFLKQKEKKQTKYPSRSTLIRLWYNISTISQLSTAQWTISNFFQQQYPKKNATRTQYTVSKMKGPPCRWYWPSIYTRVEVSASIRGCTCAGVPCARLQSVPRSGGCASSGCPLQWAKPTGQPQPAPTSSRSDDHWDYALSRRFASPRLSLFFFP